MKGFILCLCVVSAFAELPRFRPARFRLQRQELAPTTTEAPTEATSTTEEASGPYPPSGWKPAGQPFTLPKEETETAAPTDVYGPPEENAPYLPSGWKPAGQPFALPQQTPPATSYGVPDNTYGPPENVYGAPTTESDVELADPQPDMLDGPIEVQKSEGIYYVVLPNGQLQRVEFMTINDVQNQRYSAKLQLRKPAPLLLFRP